MCRRPQELNLRRFGGQNHSCRNTFGDAAKNIAIERRNFVFRYHSPAHWIEVFRAYYGPIHKAFEAIDEDECATLTHELTEILERRNVVNDGTLVMPGEYLEIVITLN